MRIIFDFDRAYLPGVWLEPVVSHSYYPPGRQHVTKSVQFAFFIQKKKGLSYNLINTTKPN